MSISTKKMQTDSALRVKWALLCKSASVDRQTNNVSLFSVIEEFTINKTPLGSSIAKRPASFPKITQVNSELTLVVQMEKKLGAGLSNFDPNIEIRIVDPSGITFATNVLPLAFEEGKNRLRMIVSFNAIPVKGPGEYNFVVSARPSKKDAFVEGARVSVDVKIFE